MYIQNDYYSINMRGKNNSPNFFKRIRDKVFDIIPEKTIKGGERAVKKWKDIDTNISHPARNRAIMGATAIITQPTIDLCNKRVDKETREISTIRTISKIVIGTLVGIGVRGSCHKLVENMTKLISKKRLEKLLLPDTEFINKMFKDEAIHKKYKSGVSTFLAVLVMCATNFLIDAPLTVFLTNFLNDKRKDKIKASGKKEGDLNE